MLQPRCNTTHSYGQSHEQVFEDPHLTHQKNAPQDSTPPSPLDFDRRNPKRLSETPASYEIPSPTLGEHTREVLMDLLGLSEEEVKGLRSRKVV